MVDYSKLREIFNSANTNLSFKEEGRASVNDSFHFKGMNVSAFEEAQALVEEGIHNDTLSMAKRCGTRQLDSVKDVNDRASRIVGYVFDSMAKGENVKDIIRNAPQTYIRDSIINPSFNIASAADPTINNIALPNVYISPWEANSLYSQQGIFETVIDKKSKSILLNGLKIENPKLSQTQLDMVKEKMEVLNFKTHLADGIRDALVYGGNLTFPLFKRDTPYSTTLPLSSLLKLGILKKDCIDYFISLDRWNTFIIPPFNPTQKDFIRPEVYTIPYLGSDVHHSRCARIVTSKQAGYWGQVMNQGWGLSDFCGYLQSGMNYKVTVQSLPLMVQQMSILARVVNVDGVLATEGSNVLDSLVEEATIRTREASPDNPVTMDVLGDIKSIDRNFGQVPDLIRLLRQDFASDAKIPEPMLFSSEKGNFASGDDTQGNLNKQWESVKMIHKSCESQVKQLAKILVIDALGADDEIIRSLPYTSLRFDEPVIANALERSQIGKNYSENVFNLVSAQIPIDIAVEMASKHVSEDMAVSATVLKKLQGIQKRVDKQDEERFNLEMEQQKASIEATEEGIEEAKVIAASGGTSTEEGKTTKGKSPAEEQREKAKADKEEKGYSKLEQKKHEKTRIGSTKRSEKKAKAQNKRV